MESLIASVSSLSYGLIYVALSVVLVIVAKVAYDLFSSFSLDKQLTEHDNPALAASLAGYMAGVFTIFLGAAVGPGLLESSDEAFGMVELAREVATVLGWSALGILLLNLGRVILDKALLYQFSTGKEIITDRNVGTGAVEGAGFLATGLMVAGSINGQGGGLLTALAFYVAGQLALILFGQVYRLVVRYDLHAEIERDNVAAGVAFGGNLIAIGIILLKATKGDFVSWAENFYDFGFYGLLSFVMLVILYKVTDHIVFPKSTLEEEIAQDQNIGAAWIESTMAIGMATVLFFMI